MQRINGPSWATFLYNHNPFYLISAGVVLFGLHSAFQTEAQNGLSIVNPYLLAGILASYIALLAITSILIVRIGRVWDDARSIFMVLILLFFALSVSFDSLCISSVSTAGSFLSAGFLFSVLTTELIIRSLGIKFPGTLRIPFYLMLGTSFFYPLIISARQFLFPQFDIRWLLILFPFVCAGAILSLIPAVRAGAKLVGKNGTPWHWPMFPYSVFVLLIVGLCGRVVLLTMAFDPSAGDRSILGSTFFAPIAMAVLVVLFEMATAEQDDELKRFTLFLSPIIFLLAVDWRSAGGQSNLMDQMSFASATPVWLALIGLAIFYLVVWFRKLDKSAAFYLTGALIGLAVLKSNGTLAQGMDDLVVWPCCLLASMQIARVNDRKKSARWLLAACWIGLAMASTLRWLDFSDVGFALTFHWVLFSAIVIGFSFRDRFANQLRVIGAVCMGFVPALVWLSGATNVLPDFVSALVLAGYAGIMGMIAMAIFWILRDHLYRYACAIAVGIGILAASWQLSPTVSAEMRHLVWFSLMGLAFFVAGVIVSLMKAGLGARIRAEFKRIKTELGRRLGTLKEDPASLELLENLDSSQ